MKEERKTGKERRNQVDEGKWKDRRQEQRKKKTDKM